MTGLIMALMLFLLGAIVGSFLNLVVTRSVRGEQWMKGRSKCDHCQHQLRWWENVPIISFIILRGKCHYCDQQIEASNLIVEVLTASLFVWWFFGGFLFFKLTRHPFTVLQPLFWLIVGLLLLVVVVYDWRYFLIPDWCIWLLTSLALLYRLILVSFGIMQTNDLLNTLLATAAVAVFFIGLWLLTWGRGLGLGDVKLVIPLGILVGWPLVIIGLFFAFLLGAIYGLVMIGLGRARLKQAVAFGPFLVFGSLLALIWGDQLLSWYQNLVGLA